jgi:diguanylate cyclase (GGDEF)-like protein
VVPGAHGEGQSYVALFSDISPLKEHQRKFEHLAHLDALTGLPNRRLLEDRLNLTMAASKRSARYCALMYLDLDNFKPLNDTHGHGAGDLLLVEVAKRLSARVREVDTVARIGGDEFVVLMGELDVNKDPAIEKSRAVAEKIRVDLSDRYLLNVPLHMGLADGVVEHQCSVSIGVVLFLKDEANQSDLLRWADATMYRAKNTGRNMILFYEENA